jgi:hypothetical protein
MLSVLDEFSQPSKCIIPLFGDEAEVAACVSKALPVQLPNALAPAPLATHEARFLHHTQVLADRLTSHLRAGRKPGDGHRAVITEA